jgi:biotin synthase-related radical SAM superfamily protein
METARKKVAPIEDRWMSVLKAAQALGCSRQGVLVSVAKGELEASHVAERVVVSRESVDALAASRATG